MKCSLCIKKQLKSSLTSHMEKIHGSPCVVLPEIREAFLATHQPTAHVIDWPCVHKKWPCPVEGCPYQASTNANFHKHFIQRHLYDSFRITDEHQDFWTKCELCGLQCEWPTLRPHLELEPTQGAASPTTAETQSTESSKSHNKSSP